MYPIRHLVSLRVYYSIMVLHPVYAAARVRASVSVPIVPARRKRGDKVRRVPLLRQQRRRGRVEAKLT